MRFKRSDLPGIVIAMVAPVLLTWLFLSAFGVWHHHGTPVLGFMAVNIAVGGGLIAAFTRFIRKWDAVLASIAVFVLVVLAVNWAQRTGNDHTMLATGLKWAGLIDFAVLNLLVIVQFLNNGLIPVLDRRDARLRARREAAGR